MFEARLTSSAVLKKVLDAIKDLLNEATFDCSDSGIQVLLNIFVVLSQHNLIFTQTSSCKQWTIHMCH